MAVKAALSRQAQSVAPAAPKALSTECVFLRAKVGVILHIYIDIYIYIHLLMCNITFIYTYVCVYIYMMCVYVYIYMASGSKGPKYGVCI